MMRRSWKWRRATSPPSSQMTTRTRLVVGLLATIMAAGTAHVFSQPIDPNTVRARLHAYLSIYETAISTLIADERFEQWPLDNLRTGLTPGTYKRDTFLLRTLESEVAFVSLPANAGWLGFRDTVRLNKKAVKRNGPPLAELLSLESADGRDRALALLLESARHNLGAPRTINLPSLPLELLHVRNQARFVIVRTSMDRVGDCNAMRLDLSETVTPTLIQRPEGGDMPSRVSAWVEPETGRLCRAEVGTRDARLGASKFEAVIAVEFARHEALDLTLPSRMREVFFLPPRGSGEGEANYTNYRRVTPTGRRPQP